MTARSTIRRWQSKMNVTYPGIRVLVGPPEPAARQRVVISLIPANDDEAEHIEGIGFDDARRKAEEWLAAYRPDA